MKIAVDTHVLVRAVVGDDPEQATLDKHLDTLLPHRWVPPTNTADSSS